MTDDHTMTFEWFEEEDGSRALVFHPKTWAAYEQAAKAQGKTAHQLITAAVAGALGTVLMDYKLDPAARADDPHSLSFTVDDGQ